MAGCVKRDSDKEGCVPRRANINTLGFPPVNPEVSPKKVEKKMEKKQVVVMDFWAPWCNPCRRFAPLFDSWSKKYSSENIKFVKVNIDEDKESAKKYNIALIPTVVITVDGKVVVKFEGMPTEEQIVAHLPK